MESFKWASGASGFYNSTYLTIDQIFSTNINSRIAFKMDFKNDYGKIYDYETVFDFDVLLVTRNNEYPIFNSEYLNYIKVGYNYDKKVKAQQESASWATAGVQMAATLLSSIVGGPIGAASAIGIGAGMVNTLIQNINQASLNQQSLEQKLNTLKMQSATVYGTDDLSLFDAYSGNKIHLIRYHVSDEIEAMLDGLFYFYGYKCDEYGIPDPNTRIFFDFLQCVPDWTANSVPASNYGNKLKPEFLDEWSRKLQEGITVYHSYLNGVFTNPTRNSTADNMEKDVYAALIA